MMRVFASLFLLASVASCGLNGPSQKPIGNGNTPASASALPLALGEAEAGKTVTVQKGQRLSLKILGTPTAGYLWSIQQMPKFVQLDRSFSSPANPEGRKNGMVGGNDWSNFDLSVLEPAAGEPTSGTMVLIYGRPWEMEKGAPPERTLSFTLAIGASASSGGTGH